MAAWLRCRLDAGMFSDEVAVTYPEVSGRQFQTSVFVPRSFVRAESEHQGEVMVDVVVGDGIRFAVLPSQDRDVVRPEEADLKPQ